MKISVLIEVDEDKVKYMNENYNTLDEAISGELNWIEESGLSVIDWHKDNRPSFKYPILNLKHLLCINSNRRNAYVLETYCNAEAYGCCEEEIAICGTPEDGILEEESLVDYVFYYSGIQVGEICNSEEPFKENSIELIQDGVTYLVDYVINDACCCDNQEHFDFNTLRAKGEE